MGHLDAPLLPLLPAGLVDAQGRRRNLLPARQDSVSACGMNDGRRGSELSQALHAVAPQAGHLLEMGPWCGASLQGCLSCADKSELSSLVLPFLYSDVVFRDFLVGQWLRLCTSTAEGLGLIAGQGSKIPYATQKT